MFRKYVLTLALMGLVACTSVPKIDLTDRVPPETTTDGVVTCVNHQDKKLDFSYRPSKTPQWYSDQYNVYVYLIDTLEGDQIAINSLELENYTCSEPTSDK